MTSEARRAVVGALLDRTMAAQTLRAGTAGERSRWWLGYVETVKGAADALTAGLGATLTVEDPWAVALDGAARAARCCPPSSAEAADMAWEDLAATAAAPLVVGDEPWQATPPRPGADASERVRAVVMGRVDATGVLRPVSAGPRLAWWNVYAAPLWGALAVLGQASGEGTGPGTVEDAAQVALAAARERVYLPGSAMAVDDLGDVLAALVRGDAR